MSRRTRPAALLAAAALLVGGSISLALAPAAAADPGDPTLGSLTYTPSAPKAGDALVVSGTGCIPGLGNTAVQNASPAAAPAADGTVAPAADPLLGSVQVTVNGPDGYSSGATVETGTDGAWTSNSDGAVITLGGAGDYTISASCQLAGVAITNYVAQSFTIADTTTPPPTTSNGTVVVNPSGTVAPGTSVSVSGFGFTGASSAAVSLNGYATQNVTIDGSGGFGGVPFTIRADQASGTLTGAVTPNSGTPQSFSIVVAASQTGNVDGTVPGGDDTSTTTSGGSTTAGSGTTTGRGYTASKPTLPNTGADTLWPGLVGGLLVLSGAGLIWAGRRREQAGPSAV